MTRALFYSPDIAEGKETRVRRERDAKKVCASCPVRDQCLDLALTQHESYGIWGGLNETERRALLRGGPRT